MGAQAVLCSHLALWLIEMARSSLLPRCILVAAIVAAANWGSTVFVPSTRRQAAAGLAASVSAMLLNTEAVQAKKKEPSSVSSDLVMATLILTPQWMWIHPAPTVNSAIQNPGSSLSRTQRLCQG